MSDKIVIRIEVEDESGILGRERMLLANAGELAKFRSFLNGGNIANWAKNALDDAFERVTVTHNIVWAKFDEEDPRVVVKADGTPYLAE